MLLVAIVVFVGLAGAVWWLATDESDDPWMLEHGHRLAVHYVKGMGPGSVDHVQQEAAISRRAVQDVRLSAVRKQCSIGERAGRGAGGVGSSHDG